MKKIINPATIISIIIFALCLWYLKTDTYREEKKYKCVVLEKYAPVPHYRSSGNYTLVLKVEGVKDLDISVSPATFYHATKGQEIYFCFAEKELHFSALKEVLLTGSLFLIIITPLFFVGACIVPFVED